MKQTLKRLLTALLATAMAVCVTAITTPKAEAANLTETEFAQRIAELKVEYPDGMYWSKTNGTDADGISKAGPNPCSRHWAAGGTCGEYKGVGWQCFGFANVMAMKIFGSYATKFSDGSYRGAGWDYYSKVDTYQAGDYVRLYGVYSGHSVFITKVEGDTISIVDANRSGYCQIDWDMTYNRSYFDTNAAYILRYNGNTLTGTGTSIPKITFKFNANGGTIPLTGQYLTRTEGDYLNVRGGPSTGTEILTSLADGSVITVYETTEQNGYLWGKIILADGREGWCAIVDSGRTEYNAVVNGYCVVDGTVTNTGADYMRTLIYGSGDGMVVPYAAAFGLTKAGYTLKGWSYSPNEGMAFSSGVTVYAEDIITANDGRDRAITLYAVWERQQPAISIHTLPEKTVYTVGEEFDQKGLQLKLVYGDGEVAYISEGLTISGFDSQTAGTKTVRVTYGTQYAEFNVTVQEPVATPPADEPTVPDIPDTPAVPPEERPAGDMNGDGETTSDDAIYLLYNVLFGATDFPIIQNADYDGDGETTSDDAIYLLYHVLFGSADFPL